MITYYDALATSDLHQGNIYSGQNYQLFWWYIWTYLYCSHYFILTWYLDNSLREPLQCVVLTKQDEDEGDLGGGHHCILIVVRCC